MGERGRKGVPRTFCCVIENIENMNDDLPSLDITKGAGFHEVRVL